jgi:addiction module HigA family antidote
MGLSVTEAAARLGVSRKTLSAILNERAAVTPRMAMRIGLATNTTPESWLHMQTAYDLWHARTPLPEVRPLAG